MENNETKPNESINIVIYNNNYISTGLTKREYFAIMELQELLANDSILITSKARDAVKAAEALIEILNKPKYDD